MKSGIDNSNRLCNNTMNQADRNLVSNYWFILVNLSGII